MLILTVTSQKQLGTHLFLFARLCHDTDADSDDESDAGEDDGEVKIVHIGDNTCKDSAH